MEFEIIGVYSTLHLKYVKKEEYKILHDHLILSNNRKYYELEMWTEPDMCPSGWQECNYAMYKFKPLVYKSLDQIYGNFKITLTPIKLNGSSSFTVQSLDDFMSGSFTIKTNWFILTSKDGGERWYPCGYFELNSKEWQYVLKSTSHPKNHSESDSEDDSDVDSENDSKDNPEDQDILLPRNLDCDEYYVIGATKLFKPDPIFTIYYLYNSDHYALQTDWTSIKIDKLPLLTHKYKYYPKYRSFRDLLSECTKEDSFIKIKGFDKQPLWIFNGNSNLGKSYIASHLSNLSVYETDSSSNIPPEIPNVDIIVTGKQTLDDIKHILPKNKKRILVTFTEI